MDNPSSPNTTHALSSLDWTVIIAYALGMLAVGLYYARQSKTSDDYLLGGRTMRPWAVGLSLFATLLSTVSYLAVPSEMIHRGPMILFGMATYPLIVLLVGWVIIPRIMQYPVTSAYEILERRLGLPSRMVGAGVFISIRLLWMAVIIYTTADKVLVPLAGLGSAATPWVCAAMGLVTLIYTSLGGLRAVVWTDVLQSLILLSAAIACLIVISLRLGGIAAWWPTQWAPHWEQFQFLPDGTPHLSMLDMMLAALTWYVCTAGSDQMAVQRYLATRNAAAARRAYITSMSADATVLLLCATLGFALLGYFTVHASALPPGMDIKIHSDRLFPRFILTELPSGITGLVVAGLLAAAMSSLSSGMNSITSVVSVDYVARFRRSTVSEPERVRLARFISLGVGVITVMLGILLVRQVQGNLLQVAYKVTNLLTAPLFLLFLMAMFIPWASGTGTILGVGISIATAVLVAYWTELTGQPGIAFTWILPLSLSTGFIVASLASLIIGERVASSSAVLSPDAFASMQSPSRRSI